jgi:hypothetical protein
MRVRPGPDGGLRKIHAAQDFSDVFGLSKNTHIREQRVFADPSIVRDAPTRCLIVFAFESEFFPEFRVAAFMNKVPCVGSGLAQRGSVDVQSVADKEKDSDLRLTFFLQ